MYIYMYILLTKHEVKMAGYWPSGWDEVKVHKNTKREQGQYPAILIETREINKGFIIWHKEHWKKLLSLYFYFRALNRKLVICKSHGTFRVSRFLVPSRERNHRKSSNSHWKYFAKENFGAPAWILVKYSWKKTGNRQQSRWSNTACTGS